jgi:glycosyltransferase involved in cell wall biosynthesis
MNSWLNSTTSKISSSILTYYENEITSKERRNMGHSIRNLVKVGVVIPAHNEENFIEQCINSLEEFISMNKTKYIISTLIAEDGSTDSTFRIITHLVRKYENITIKHDPNKLGRGRAVKEAWRSLDVDIYVYFDADLATSISYLNRLLECCERGFDVVTGSRYVSGSDVTRPIIRKIISKSYNHLIDLFFRTSVRDHQCGFKAVTKRARDIILKESIFDDWFWDTEIFVIARRNGLNIHEVPVEWQERRGTKTPIKRLLKDVCVHGSGIIKLLIKQRSAKF